VSSFARRDADGIDLIYPGPDGRTPHYRGQPIRSAEEYAEVQLSIQARRAERRVDRLCGTPCIACGAPIRRNWGHDPGCPAARPTEALPSSTKGRTPMDTNTTTLTFDDNEIIDLMNALEAAESTELHDKVAAQFNTQLSDQQAG
jgi:hypothetical protein